MDTTPQSSPVPSSGADSSSLRLLRLLQWVSPGLPVGAFAYSHGLEMAVARGWVRDAAGARDWVSGLLHHAWARLDGPVMLRCHRALAAEDFGAFSRWEHWLAANRESSELLAEDRHLGTALTALLADMELSLDSALLERPEPGFAGSFALAAWASGVDDKNAMLGLLWSCTDHQVAAALKLVPLGQSAAQRILMALGSEIPAAAELAATLGDEALGASLPGLAIASAQHETLYSRLFRS